MRRQKKSARKWKKWKKSVLFGPVNASYTYTEAHMALHTKEVGVKNAARIDGKKRPAWNNGEKKSFMIKFLIYVIESFKYGIANKYGLHILIPVRVACAKGLNGFSVCVYALVLHSTFLKTV